jgi:hypothetical protein
MVCSWRERGIAAGDVDTAPGHGRYSAAGSWAADDDDDAGSSDFLLRRPAVAERIQLVQYNLYGNR